MSIRQIGLALLLMPAFASLPTLAAPQVNTEAAVTAVTLFGLALAVARGRRRRLAAARA